MSAAAYCRRRRCYDYHALRPRYAPCHTPLLPPLRRYARATCFRDADAADAMIVFATYICHAAAIDCRRCYARCRRHYARCAIYFFVDITIADTPLRHADYATLRRCTPLMLFRRCFMPLFHYTLFLTLILRFADMPMPLRRRQRHLRRYLLLSLLMPAATPLSRHYAAIFAAMISLHAPPYAHAFARLYAPLSPLLMLCILPPLSVADITYAMLVFAMIIAYDYLRLFHLIFDYAIATCQTRFTPLFRH